MEHASIVMFEDDLIAAKAIKQCLNQPGYKVDFFTSANRGLSMVRQLRPDIVILDMATNGLDGSKLCHEMRTDPSVASVPILFLIEQIKDEEKLPDLNLGSDDFLTKPFNCDELNLRVRAMLRRKIAQQNTIRYPFGSNLTSQAFNAMKKIHPPKNGGQKSQRIVVKDYVLHTQTYELCTPDRGKIRLTPIQFSLLYHLMTHLGQIFSPEQLLGDVWNYPSDAGSPDLVRMHIKNLRSRLESNPSHPMFIKTVTGFGYTINPEMWDNQKETS